MFDLGSLFGDVSEFIQQIINFFVGLLEGLLGGIGL